MVDPFSSFEHEEERCVGRLTCAVWDRASLRVYVPFFQGHPRPVERQIRIAKEISATRKSIRDETENAMCDILERRFGILDLDASTACALMQPDIWIPPAIGFPSALDDAFTLVFENLLDGRFQGVALVDGWKLKNVDAICLPQSN
jgi:hypothetical protein